LKEGTSGRFHRENLFILANLDGVPIWCGSFLNREEREVRKDLMVFLRVPGVLTCTAPNAHRPDGFRECGASVAVN
jgi:hypothetical protein